MSDAIQLCLSGIYAVFDFFIRINNSLDFMPYVYAVLAAMLVIRFLVYPLMKSNVSGNGSGGAHK